MSVAQSPPPRGSLQVARVAGVPVYIGRGWLLLAAFVAWTGWSNNRDLGTGAAVVYAGTLVVSILVAVLGHEVAHAVSARLVGLRVHRIVADLWGGHTAFDGSGVTAGRNAIVSVSGPLANVAMAGIGAVLLVALPSSVSSFAWPFVVLNLLLGGFNMLPGLPLDGGHLVHSLVWGVSGRRDLGLLVAGWCGRVVAGLVVVGFVVLPVAQGRADLFQVALALVMAWILWSGATAAVRRAPLERLLERVRTEDVLDPVALVPVSTPWVRPCGTVCGSCPSTRTGARPWSSHPPRTAHRTPGACLPRHRCPPWWFGCPTTPWWTWLPGSRRSPCCGRWRRRAGAWSS